MGQATKEEYAEKELNFRETIQPGRGTRITQFWHLAGKVTQVLFHFPPGCAGLVEMRLLKDEQPFYPVVGYLALDNSTPVHNLGDGIEYYAKEPLTVEILNHDGINPHTPTVTVTVKYKRPWWDKSG
jgi:hypothetical protein